jgi:ectoine hydroxylase-related dioxygenase (phytanoyl-CoA dioxygenase family)
MNTQPSDPVRLVTPEEVALYRKNGWASLPQLVPTDIVARMLTEARSLIDKGSQFENAWQSYTHVVRDHGIEPFRTVAFSKIMARNVQLLTGRDEWVRMWVDTIACKQPIGSEIGAGPTPWHQDLPHYPHDRAGHVAMWLALDEVTPERGAMRFLSGSHREGPLGRVFGTSLPDTVDRYPYLTEDYEVSEPLHLLAGDATCHSGMVVHSAPHNTTDQPRWSFIFTYIPDDILYTGAPNYVVDGSGVEVGGRFDSPRFPLVGV